MLPICCLARERSDVQRAKLLKRAGYFVFDSISVAPFGRGICAAPRSRLPGLEIDAGIDPGVGEVGEEVHHEAEKREDVEVREHHRVVAIDDRLEGEEAEPVEGEDRLDE